MPKETLTPAKLHHGVDQIFVQKLKAVLFGELIEKSAPGTDLIRGAGAEDGVEPQVGQ